MSKQVNLELLEKYLAGEITPDEVLDTDGQRLTGEELKRFVDEHKDLSIQLEGVGLKARLQEILPVQEEVKSSQGYRLWFMAAAVLLLAAFAFLWQQNQKEPSLEQFFTHFDQFRTVRGEGEGTFYKGLEAYSRRNYNEAYRLLGANTLTDEEILFYYGVSALASEHLAEAKTAFEQIGIATTNRYYQQTRWYLALVHWQLDEPSQALILLNEIHKGEYEYDKAQELIELLR